MIGRGRSRPAPKKRVVDSRYEMEQHRIRLAKSQERMASYKSTMKERAKDPNDPIAHPTFIMRNDRQLLRMALDSMNEKATQRNVENERTTQQLRKWAMQPLPGKEPEQEIRPPTSEEQAKALSVFRRELLKQIIEKKLCTKQAIRAEFEQQSMKETTIGIEELLENEFLSICTQLGLEANNEQQTPTNKEEEIQLDFSLGDSDSEPEIVNPTRQDTTLSQQSMGMQPNKSTQQSTTLDWANEMDELNSNTQPQAQQSAIKQKQQPVQPQKPIKQQETPTTLDWESEMNELNADPASQKQEDESAMFPVHKAT